MNVQNDTNEVPIGTCYSSKTYRKRLFCGNIHVIVNYKIEDEEKIDSVQFTISSKEAWCGAVLEALALQTTFCIRRIRNEHCAKAIVKNLRGHQCQKCRANKEHLKSCADAIGMILGEELGIYKVTKTS